jgi:diguanylate cyclase (GGDEF)-like protein/PAS domain S-box-containing protein
MLRAVIDNNQSLIYVKDLYGRYLLANPPFERAFAVSEADLLGNTDDFLDAELAPVWRQNDLRAQHEAYAVEEWSDAEDGCHWYESVKFPLVDASGEVYATCGVSLDVTARRHAEHAQRKAEERFRSAFDNAPIGVVLMGVDRRTLQVNGAMHKMLGYPPDALVGIFAPSVVHPEDVHIGEDAVRSVLRGEQQAATYEIRFIHADGHPVWVSASVTALADSDGPVSYLMVHAQDITDRRRYEDQLHQLADRDPLTGLLNRRSFERELNRHTAEVSRYGATGALLLIDLDHFDAVNDTLGHKAGDDLIASIANLLQYSVRCTDHVARLSGDEFALLVPRGGRDGATALANKIGAFVRHHTATLGGAAQDVTASIGIAVFDGNGDSGDEMLNAANLALYQAKAAGNGSPAAKADTDAAPTSPSSEAIANPAT